MKIKLDSNLRKFIKIEIEIEDEMYEFKYFDRNTRQIQESKELVKKEGSKMYEYEELSKVHFFENLQGDQDVIDKLIAFYDENGNIYDFMQSCDEEMGKQKKRG